MGIMIMMALLTITMDDMMLMTFTDMSSLFNSSQRDGERRRSFKTRIIGI